MMRACVSRCAAGATCYENFSSGNYGGVIIDLSGMQGVSLDRSGLVRVEGGATLWNVYETLFKEYNLTLPGGSATRSGWAATSWADTGSCRGSTG